MKKRLCASILAFVVLASGCLAGCGKGADRECELTFKPKSVSLIASEGQEKLSPVATINGEEDKNPQITYTVADPSIASVSASGEVSGLKRGRTNVKANYRGTSTEIPVSVFEEATSEQVNTFAEDYVNRYGRQYFAGNSLVIDHVSSALEVGFYGTSLTGSIKTVGDVFIHVFVDGKDELNFSRVETGENVVFATGLREGIHTARIVKASEIDRGSLQINSLAADRFLAVPENDGLKMEFIGDSITAGYGNLVQGGTWSVENSDGCKSYAYLTAERLGANYSIVALSGISVKVHMWGSEFNMMDMHSYVSNRTKEKFTAYDKDMDVVVLGLGTNDASYMDQTPAYANDFATDYKAFLTHLREVYPDAYIVCIYGMMGIKPRAEKGIQSAIRNMADEKISYKTFKENNVGASGHPYYLAHTNFAKELASYIEGLYSAE